MISSVQSHQGNFLPILLGIDLGTKPWQHTWFLSAHRISQSLSSLYWGSGSSLQSQVKLVPLLSLLDHLHGQLAGSGHVIGGPKSGWL